MQQDCPPLAVSSLDSNLLRVARAAAWRFQALAARNYRPDGRDNPDWEKACKGLLPFLGTRREDLLQGVGQMLDGQAYGLFRMAVARLIDCRPILVPVRDAMVQHEEFLLAIPLVHAAGGANKPGSSLSEETRAQLTKAFAETLKFPASAKVVAASWCVGLRQAQALNDCERFGLLQYVLEDNKPEWIDACEQDAASGGCLVLVGILVPARHRSTRSITETCKKRQRKIERILRRQLWGENRPTWLRIGPCSGYMQASAQGVVEEIMCVAMERARRGLPAEVNLSASTSSGPTIVLRAAYPGAERTSHPVDSVYAVTVLRRLWRGLTERGITVRFDGDPVMSDA